MTVGTRELRAKLGEVLEQVRLGKAVTITKRGEPVAVLKPLRRRSRREPPFEPIGIGMWRDRKEMRDPVAWVNSIRTPRFPR